MYDVSFEAPARVDEIAQDRAGNAENGLVVFAKSAATVFPTLSYTSKVKK